MKKKKYLMKIFMHLHAPACTIKGTDTDGKGSGTIIR